MTTIEELLDLEAIRKLRVLYSHHFDMNECEKLGELFSEDAICEFGEAYGGDWVGRAEIVKRYQAVHGENPEPFAFMHATTNHDIELTGPDSAKGRAYLLDLNLRPGIEQPLLLCGVYDDLYKKVAGRWYIHRTRIDFIWPRRDYHGRR